MALGLADNAIPPDRRGNTVVPLNGVPSADADVGEYLQVGTDPDEFTVLPTEDGGAMIDMPGEREDREPQDAEFYSNLATVVPKPVQDEIITDLLRRIESDKRNREPRDKQYEEGIRRTGLGKDAPGGADFEGASRAVHPLMTESCVDYAARVMKELWPPSGPVKPDIVGAPTAEKISKANRVAEHMNWQLTRQMKEARAVLETTLTQVPLGGSQFIRLYYDHRLKRPRMEFASVDQVYVPANAADFQSAQRKTFADSISAVELKHRIASGMYLDVNLPSPGQQPENTKAKDASMKVEGVEDDQENLDSVREIYEVQTYLEVTEDMADELKVEKAGELYPYLLTIDVSSKTMLSMYRCWEEHDEAHEQIDVLFEFPFLPWRGALGIGFPQVIGGLSAAATGALRALLDSAHIANAPGGFLLKGASVSGQTRSPPPGTFAEIDGGLEADDIRKKIMPFAVSQPSSVLFQLLGFVTEAAKGVVRTSMDESPAEGSTPTPVGTQMSRVEEALTVFSAVHARAHAAMNRLLAGLYRLNRLYLPDQLKVDAAGKEILVRRVDYEGPANVQPVSDPTIYTDQQRFSQLNYIQARMLANPTMWKPREVELAGLKLMKWPAPELLLQDMPAPKELSAVNENIALTLGQPVRAWPEQSHLAHLQVLLDYAKSPVLGAHPAIAPVFLQGAIKHAVEHIAFAYAQSVVDKVEQVSGKRIAGLLSKDPSAKYEMDMLLAQTSQLVVPEMEQTLKGVAPVLSAMLQTVKSLMPQPPMDPALAAVQAAGAETARKAKADQADSALDAQKLQVQASGQQQQNAINGQRNQVTADNAQLQAETKVKTTAMDNQSAQTIATEKLESGVGTGFSDGSSLTH